MGLPRQPVRLVQQARIAGKGQVVTGYILRRGAASVLVLLLITVITFLLVHLQKGDVLTVKLRQRLPEEQVQALRAELGLDRPLWEQYGDWLWGVLRGDLGRSFFRERQPVWERIQAALPVTLELVSMALAISVITGVPIGVVSAIRRNSVLDQLGRFLAVIGLAVPVFWLGTVVLVYGGIWFQYSPPLTFTYFWDDPLRNLETMWLPALVLGYNLSAITMRITRSTVLEVMRQDYVRTAWAKGLQERLVVTRHVLSNSLIPVITIIGNQFVFIMGATVIVEYLFHLPGIGFVALESITTRDYNLVQATVLVVGAMVVAANFLVDLIYARLDPRVRLGASAGA
jgi:peptide/nickel transport system permease protein